MIVDDNIKDININIKENVTHNTILLDNIFQFIISEYEFTFNEIDLFLNNIDFQKLCEIKEKVQKEKYFIDYIEDIVNQLSFNINGITKIDKLNWNTLPFTVKLDLVNRYVVEKLSGSSIKSNIDLLKSQFLSSILIYSNINNAISDDKVNLSYSLNFMSHFKRLGIIVNSIFLLNEVNTSYVRIK